MSKRDHPSNWFALGHNEPDGWHPLHFDWTESALYTHRDQDPHIFSFMEDGDVISDLTNAVFQ